MPSIRIYNPERPVTEKFFPPAYDESPLIDEQALATELKREQGSNWFEWLVGFVFLLLLLANGVLFKFWHDTQQANQRLGSQNDLLKQALDTAAVNTADAWTRALTAEQKLIALPKIVLFDDVPPPTVVPLDEKAGIDVGEPVIIEHRPDVHPDQAREAAILRHKNGCN